MTLLGAGNTVGRALLIDKWMLEDGTKGGPGNAVELAAQPVAEEDIAAVGKLKPVAVTWKCPHFVLSG